MRLIFWYHTRLSLLILISTVLICDFTEIGHAPLQRGGVDNPEWRNAIWMDTSLCNSEGARPIYGVEFWAQHATQLRVIMVRKEDQQDWIFLGYTNEVHVSALGVFRVWFREPKLFDSGLCIGWMSEIPTIPYDGASDASDVFVGRYYEAVALGAEIPFVVKAPPRNYSIRVLTSANTMQKMAGSQHQAVVSLAERRLTEQQPRAHGTAVCIAGALRMLNLTARSIMDMFVKPLSGDLFLYGPKPRVEDQDALGWLMMDPATKVVKLLAENLTASMRALPRFQTRHLSTAACEIPGSWLGGAPIVSKCAMEELPKYPGWVPPQGQVEGSNVFQMWARKQCMTMIAEYETNLRGGRHYETVVYSRSDLKWLLPHPTIQQLEAYKISTRGWDTVNFANPKLTHRTWVPTTLLDDWGGVYDRHIVLPRWLMESSGIMDDLDLVLHGFALDLIKRVLDDVNEKTLGGGRTKTGVNSELFLFVRLWFGGANLARFPAVAYVACDYERWNHHFESKSASVKHRWSKGTPCQEGGYRFPHEHRAATTFVKCMSMRKERTAAHLLASNLTENTASFDKARVWDDYDLMLHCESKVHDKQSEGIAAEPLD